MTQLENELLSQGPSTSTSAPPRHEAQIGSGLAPGRNLTVLNLLLALVQDEASVVRIDDEEYVRAAPRRVDPQIVATGSDRYVVVRGVRSSDESFNFSLTGEQTVLVRLNRRGSPTSMRVVRTYNVIREGKLVLPSLQAMLGEHSFTILRDAQRLTLDGRALEAGEARQENVYYTIRLEGLRLVSSDWARPEQQGLVSLLKQEEDLRHALTQLNARADQLQKERLPPAVGSSTPELPYYRSKGTKSEEPVETRDRPIVQYELMGYVPKSFDASAYEDRATVDLALRRQRRELMFLRFRIRAICFAIESCTTGKPIAWSDPLKDRKTKYPRTLRMAILDGAVLQRLESVVSATR